MGTLYLIPTPIAYGTDDQVLPSYNKSIVANIDYFIVENERTARRAIKQWEHPKPIADLIFFCLDKHQPKADLEKYVKPLQAGMDLGILSEAGCPGIADPGSHIVAYAHKNNIAVIPLVGPCSITLALMASGFNGQQFVFNGYLPIDKLSRQKAIKSLEYNAYQSLKTQIFIETPYRNTNLFLQLIQLCKPDTLLCIASALTSPTGWIKTLSVQKWRNIKPIIEKVPTIFLIASPNF